MHNPKIRKIRIDIADKPFELKVVEVLPECEDVVVVLKEATSFHCAASNYHSPGTITVAYKVNGVSIEYASFKKLVADIGMEVPMVAEEFVQCLYTILRNALGHEHVLVVYKGTGIVTHGEFVVLKGDTTLLPYISIA